MTYSTTVKRARNRRIVRNMALLAWTVAVGASAAYVAHWFFVTLNAY